MRAARAAGAARHAAAWVAVAACLVVIPGAAHGEDLAAQARQTVERWADAVITVRVVAKWTVSYAGSGTEEEEEKADLTGTVIDPSGLTVTSLSELDPAEMMRATMGEGGSSQSDVRVDSTLRDLKLRFADGKEVPAKVVLRDRDLDLAFVRPQEKLPEAAPMLDLSDSAVPKLLDQIVLVDRLYEIANWTTMTGLDRIGAVLEKPRTMYIPWDGDYVVSPGTPAFLLDGRIVGILVSRATPSAAAGVQGASEDFGSFIVILPAAAILEVAKQAEE